jgi:hypothetical protein
VIVIVQQYCWVFTFIVFVGDGWLALVTAHLPQLRLLYLVGCNRVCDKDIAELVAAVPELVAINRCGDNVGAGRNELLEITDKRGTLIEYEFIKQWAIDREIRRQQL